MPGDFAFLNRIKVNLRAKSVIKKSRLTTEVDLYRFLSWFLLYCDFLSMGKIRNIVKLYTYIVSGAKSDHK